MKRLRRLGQLLKRWIFISVLSCCGSAQAQEPGPWFGGEVISPEQVSVVATTTNVSEIDQEANCTIYSCPKSKNIVKPELKSASNP